MGSRYGGLKQLDPMGPHGETLLDYSIHDAMAAGFNRVVFVIRRDIEEAFRSTIGSRYAGSIQVDYVFQDLDDLPPGFTRPTDRTKPWGTGHAILAARKAISGPFAVINADDFYGADAYQVIARYFARCSETGTEPLALVAYRLDRTLSEHGSVNRGICQASEGRLLSVEEITAIARHDAGHIRGLNSVGGVVELSEDALVSMNFWGFSHALFGRLEQAFQQFLTRLDNPSKGEFYIPAFIDQQIAFAGAHCDLLSTNASWFGVTYPADKPHVQDQIRQLVNSGQYPSPLQMRP